MTLDRPVTLCNIARTSRVRCQPSTTRAPLLASLSSIMDPQPVAVRLVEKASAVHFDATAVFKISNIRRYFEGGPEAKSSDDLTFSTSPFGPGLYIEVSPNEKGEGMDIHLHLPKAKYIPQPIAVKYSVTVFPLSRCTSEDTKELFHVGEESDEWKVGDAGGRGWSPAVDLGDWEDHESLRSDNGLCLVVQAKSLRDYPTSDSPPALDVLHKTIVATPSPITVRFTAFSRRALSGRLSNPCILSVDRGVIDNSCPVLSQSTCSPNSSDCGLTRLFIQLYLAQLRGTASW